MEELYQKLENVTMEDEEEDTTYDNKYENHFRLTQTVTFLTNGGRVTEDWKEEHRRHILKYREVFPNFAEVNEEVDDPDFRRTAQETEVLLANLVQSIRANRFIDRNDLKFYLMLNQHMIKLCEYFFEPQDFDKMKELEAYMSKMSI